MQKNYEKWTTECREAPYLVTERGSGDRPDAPSQRVNGKTLSVSASRGLNVSGA